MSDDNLGCLAAFVVVVVGWTALSVITVLLLAAAWRGVR